MNELQGQNLVNRQRVVAVTLNVTSHHFLKRGSLQVRAAESFGVEQHFLYISRERVPIPDTEMVELVSSEENLLWVEGRKQAVDWRSPLRHAVVVGIFRLRRKIQKAPNGLGAPTILA